MTVIRSKNYDGEPMTLVLEGEGQPVEQGMILTSFRGERFRVTDGRAPHKPGSTGRVYCVAVDDQADGPSSEFYPGVIKAMWMHDSALAAMQGAMAKAEEEEALPTLPAPKRKMRVIRIPRKRIC